MSLYFGTFTPLPRAQPQKATATKGLHYVQCLPQEKWEVAFARTLWDRVLAGWRSPTICPRQEPITGQKETQRIKGSPCAAL